LVKKAVCSKWSSFALGKPLLELIEPLLKLEVLLLKVLEVEACQHVLVLLVEFVVFLVDVA